MSYSYYPQALLQEMLHISNLHSLQRLQQEVQELKEAIYSKQKKHRRCDKDISKNVTVTSRLFSVLSAKEFTPRQWP